MRVQVVPPSRHDPLPAAEIVLQQDMWNDFSYQTQYHLYVFLPDFSGRIGPVKILRRRQSASDGLQLQVGPLPPLQMDFCSLGQTLDYYERLAGLPDDIRGLILQHLRDALAFPEHAASFFGEPGWNTSVLRDVEWESFSRDASVLLDRNYDRVARLELEMSFHVTGWLDPLRLNFGSPDGAMFWTGVQKLPRRVQVLTGRNGSGKSTLLARLARVLHASQRERAGEALQALGRIEPPGVGFTRVLNLAYSAFDAFQMPGSDEKERKQIAEDLRHGRGRYHFCGLRDVVREIEEGIAVGAEPAAGHERDRQKRTVLKSADQLSAEFEQTVARIWEFDRQDLFREALDILSRDPSFQDLGPNPTSTLSEHPAMRFEALSTGLKIVLHAVAAVVAYTESKSIILFDEPETHLHPPLLAAFMHALRLILERNDAFAVIATHSPVVTQETLSRHVAVVRRSGESVTVRPPRIETYGESIGEITDEVFGLNAEATDFHAALAELVGAGIPLEFIEQMFERGLSLQARAFVMTEIARRG